MHRPSLTTHRRGTARPQSRWRLPLGIVGILGLLSQASAASLTSDAFVAGTRPIIDYLVVSSHMALDHTGDRRIRAFARRQETAQLVASDAFTDWTAKARLATIDESHTRSIDGLGPLLGLAHGPFNGSLLLVPPPGAERNIGKQLTLAHLDKLRGQEFDALYTVTQREGLERLVEIYTDFIKNGDDPGLRTLAVHQLPKVKGLLAAIKPIDRS